MRATSLAGQIASSLALFSLLAGTSSQRDGNWGAPRRHMSLPEQEASEQDLMYGTGLAKADINSLLPSDEMPRSTTSTKTTFYFTRSRTLSATPTTLLSPSPTNSSSSEANGESSSYGQTSDLSTERSSKSLGETTNPVTQANHTSTAVSETLTSTLSSVSTETRTLKSTSKHHRTSSKHRHEPSRSSGALVTSTETIVTISTSTSLIYTNMTLPQPGTSMPGDKSSTMSMNFTIHNSFTSQLPTFSPSETSALPNVTSTSTLSYTSTLTFTSQASGSSNISLSKPHGASHSLPTTFPLSNSTIYSTSTSLATVAVSTSVNASSTPRFPLTNATLVSGPTAISNTGTGVAQTTSTSTLLASSTTWLETNGTVSSKLPLPSINATSVPAHTESGSEPVTTITVPIIFTPLPSFNLTTVPLVTGTGGGVSSERSSGMPYPVTNSSSLSQPTSGHSTAGAISGSGFSAPSVTPFLTTTFSLPYQANKTIVESITANTSCIETQTTTETDTWLTLVTSTETHHKHHSTTKSDTRKHEATSMSVSVSTLPCCMPSSEPVFSIETSTPASSSSRHHQFSSPTWLIHSADPTTFVTETSCISDFVPAASETLMNRAEGQRIDSPAGLTRTEHVVSPASAQQDFLRETLTQKFKRKVDKVLASFGYGSRTTGDGWP